MELEREHDSEAEIKEDRDHQLSNDPLVITGTQRNRGFRLNQANTLIQRDLN